MYETSLKNYHYKILHVGYPPWINLLHMHKATSTLSIHRSKHAIVQCTNFAYKDCEGVTCNSALQQLHTVQACTSYHSPCDVVFTVEMYPVHWIAFTQHHRPTMA